MHVLAALNAVTHEVWTVKNLTYSTAETVWELWSQLARAHAGLPLTIILDNARYQRCRRVQTVANSCGIELLYLPTYSPNLNLIERFWKFVKKQCLYSKYYPDSESFQQAISTCLEQASSTHKKALESLLTWRFQPFQNGPVIGEQHTASTGPKKKVLSKAA